MRLGRQQTAGLDSRGLGDHFDQLLQRTRSPLLKGQMDEAEGRSTETETEIQIQFLQVSQSVRVLP